MHIGGRERSTFKVARTAMGWDDFLERQEYRAVAGAFMLMNSSDE